MGARHKLNAGYFHGAIFVAVLIGLLFGSWWIFILAAVVLLIGAVMNQEIRLKPHDNSRRRR